MTNVDSYFSPYTRTRGRCRIKGCISPTEVRVSAIIRNGPSNVRPAKSRSHGQNFCLAHGAALYEQLVSALDQKDTDS